MNAIAEETAATSHTPAPKEPKPKKKARAAKRARHVALAKGQSGRKASPRKNTPAGANKATTARDGTKTNAVLALLKRNGGATLTQLMTATGWQPHSVRGFLSGTVGKKMGLAVTSSKDADGERVYFVKG